MSALYRVRQFVRAAGAWTQPASAEAALLQRYLPPTAVRLFEAMPAYDRRHALGVLDVLRDAGHTDPDLLAAALLHDVGKTAQGGDSLRIWHRVAVVLLRVASPDLLTRIGQDRPGSWRRPFFVQQHHAALSAELAREAGCSARTVDLIRRHEDPPDPADDSLLAALQAADSRN